MPVAVAGLLYVILFFVLFPVYRYVLDIDAISYIHVAERVAKGNYWESINGYWSPLISWLLVPFIRWGFDPVLSAKYLNGAIGLCCLFCSCRLMNRLAIHRLLQQYIPFVLAIIFLSYAFYELCADLLQLLFLLLYLLLITSNGFINNGWKLSAAGALGAIAYYAKAYSFPFFLLQAPIVVYVCLKHDSTDKLWKKAIQKTGLMYLIFLLISLPYVLVLSNKYGSFRINNAGKLNMSWFLSPGASNARHMVAEPPYADATSYWDEPTYAQDKIITPFTSVRYFFKEIKWTTSNAIKLGHLLNDISVFSIVIAIGFAFYLYRKRREASLGEWLLMVFSFLYPLGYLMIFVEWRYIWLLPISYLFLGAILLSKWPMEWLLPKRSMALTFLLFCSSFLWQPVHELWQLRNSNRDVYEMSEVFKQQQIKGNFLLNYQSFTPYFKTVVLCYLTGSKLYGPQQFDYDAKELLQTIQQHHIQYYLFYYDFPSQKEMFLQSNYAKSGTKLYPDLYPGIVLVEFK